MERLIEGMHAARSSQSGEIRQQEVGSWFPVGTRLGKNSNYANGGSFLSNKVWVL